MNNVDYQMFHTTSYAVSLLRDSKRKLEQYIVDHATHSQVQEWRAQLDDVTKALNILDGE